VTLFSAIISNCATHQKGQEQVCDRLADKDIGSAIQVVVIRSITGSLNLGRRERDCRKLCPGLYEIEFQTRSHEQRLAIMGESKHTAKSEQSFAGFQFAISHQPKSQPITSLK
jgi:hypothetical protein